MHEYTEAEMVEHIVVEEAIDAAGARVRLTSFRGTRFSAVFTQRANGLWVMPFGSDVPEPSAAVFAALVADPSVDTWKLEV